jgi:hypothetical protein
MARLPFFTRKISGIPIRGRVDPSARVRLEELGQLKNSMFLLGIEPATFRLVAYCLNQLRQRLPPGRIYCLKYFCIVKYAVVIHSVFKTYHDNSSTMVVI